MGKYIYYNYGFSKEIKEKINFIKQSGFDGVFLFCDRKTNKKLVNNLRNEKLEIETLHLPYRYMCNNLWVKGKRGEKYKDVIIKGIKKAKRLDIKTVIMHISSSDCPPAYNSLGLERINEILKYCEKYNIILALENLRRLDYLDYILENCNSKKLKFCFDSGHANAFTKNINNFNWNKYKDKLHCVHLHDNNGLCDEHLLPFTGNIDWNKLMIDLNNINYSGNLTLEVIHNFDKDKIGSEKDFIEKAYKAISKLEEMKKNG
ncbi:MAG: sugar phosphate isomerase/epimerase [Bacilli bacterium]|nr:sugar phosphate isomerase/epimerase [Bacilli bacterium]